MANLMYDSNLDNSILILDSSGIMKSGRILSFKSDVSYDSTYHNNFLLQVDKYYYYGGETTGFTTQLQTATFNYTKLTVFVNKFWMDKPNNYGCMYEKAVDSGKVNDRIANLR